MSPTHSREARQEEPQDCPQCGNGYLAIRIDIYKDEREFVYCDGCGCLADRRVWNRIAPLARSFAGEDRDYPLQRGIYQRQEGR